MKQSAKGSFLVTFAKETVDKSHQNSRGFKATMATAAWPCIIAAGSSLTQNFDRLRKRA